MATKKPPAAPAKKPTAPAAPATPATSDGAANQRAADTHPSLTPTKLDASTNATANAQRSLIDALQADLDDERMRSLTSRTQLERRVTALELTLDEVRAELARATARSRELEAQLLQLRGAR